MKYLLIILLLTGCYNQRKASQQFSRAVTFDQKIGSDYCASTFPSISTTVHDTTITTDSIYIEGAERLDTVMSHDTLRITRTITLPSQVVTHTVHIIDTVRVENTAALKSCQIDNSRLIAQADKITDDRDRLKGGRNNWRLIALISLGVNALGVYLKMRKLV